MIDCFRSLLVAATIRTSVRMACVRQRWCTRPVEARAADGSVRPSAYRRFRRETACRPRPARTDRRAVLRASKSPFSWPNNSDSIRSPRYRRHVDSNEGDHCDACRNRAARAPPFLAGSRLAGDHQRQIRLHQAGQDAINFLHCSRASDERHAILRISSSSWQACASFGEGPADDGDQFCQVERLRQVIIRALFRRLNAVMKVFCALITNTGSSGRAFLMRGRRSKAFSSGITTSVMTRSPSPAETQRHSVAALEVMRTS